ncbi:hypothetical protein OH786_00415 [Streptomyces atratus]|uniref:Uncharacterized protein n=1 Tax=Streptomyces atratus TaxID=1893 RepID=A0A1K2F625_STRAR|nr:hypothetical protein [Streptomyces atratus]SFY43255.1 hypothetical protein SAMN02787144_103512 [Streptomyces atratus]
MASLDELPPYRRAQLLWRCVHQGVAFVAALVRDAEKLPCRLPSPPPGPPGKTVAVPGDDGRFHLERASRMLCGELKAAAAWRHRHH